MLDDWKTLDWTAAATLAALLIALLVGLSGVARRRRGFLLASLAAAGLFGLGHVSLRLGLLYPFTAPLEAVHRPAVLTFATLFWAAAALSFRFALDRFVFDGPPRADGQPRVPLMVRQFVTLGIVLVAVMVVVRYVFDQPITGLIATSGVVAVILGYSAQSTLGEVFSGLSLSLTRAFRRGEWVQIDGVDGMVLDSNWRAVTVRNFDRNLVQIPNTVAASQRIISYDRPIRPLRRFITFWVEYETSPALVKRVSEAAMRESRLVAEDPAPFTIGVGFGEYGVEYRAYWFATDAEAWVPDAGEVVSAIWHAFHRAGIQFGYARRDALPYVPRMESAPPAHAELDVTALIRAMDIFESLSDEDIAELAASAEVHRYGPPERIIREREDGESMFLIARGHVVVTLDQGGEELRLATIGPGEHVGVMTLLTGEPRSATVRAIDLVEVVEIHKSALQPLLARRGELVDTLAAAAARIQEENRSKRAAWDEAHKDDGPREKRNVVAALAGRIRGFFGTNGKG